MSVSNGTDADREYREVIDRLVDDCRKGQGQVSSRRVLSGVWNQNATADELTDEHKINLLLARMPVGDREILARILEEAFVAGVHQSLVALHEFGVPPFEKAYEGTPFHDFVGRLDGWEWPISTSRY